MSKDSASHDKVVGLGGLTSPPIAVMLKHQEGAERPRETGKKVFGERLDQLPLWGDDEWPIE